uniref:Uncharacterized protein n=1 Tax=Arundo donax TaxID=35708 RepID=A0A0A8YEI7_ARUDO
MCLHVLSSLLRNMHQMITIWLLLILLQLEGLCYVRHPISDKVERQHVRV